MAAVEVDLAKENEKLVGKARNLVEKLEDIDASSPADMTFKELVRVAKAHVALVGMVTDLADSLDETEAARGDLELTVAQLEEQVEGLEAEVAEE
jgi:N-acetylmuramic acid 6-phosphate (MurNAc-6-P) etherase